ncbi:MAG: hypothetical protein ACKPKU_12965 [Dolichospermum sp.]
MVYLTQTELAVSSIYSTYQCYEVQDHPTPNPLPASREVAMMYFITKESAVYDVIRNIQKRRAMYLGR